MVKKRKFGSFWDGFANGVLPGWAVAVELRGGQSVENVREYEKKVHYAEDVLADFLPPEYPFEIDHELAKKGEHYFSNTCAKCHGSYERDLKGLPIYKQPKLIPIEVVKTDRERIDFVTDDFLELVDNNPLNDLMQYLPQHKRKGYIAPRLWGIWSRFPYLHNASVPTIRDLLLPSEMRPQFFSLKNAGEEYRYDYANMGLKVERDKQSDAFQNVKKEALRGNRRYYNTKRVGHGNQGHVFKFYKTMTEDDRLAIIEYLKTL
jgi:hypothetical protein